MKLIVNILGVEIRLKQATILEPESGLLKDVVKALKACDGGQVGRFVADDLASVNGSTILVNGRNFLSLDGWETLIREGDELTFMVPVAGG